MNVAAWQARVTRLLASATSGIACQLSVASGTVTVTEIGAVSLDKSQGTDNLTRD